MGHGPGIIERRIADLFARTRHRALPIDVITDHAFELHGEPPTRAQRLSATRAAHRLLRRVRELDARADALRDEARKRTQQDQPEEDPAWRAATKLAEEAWRIGLWVRMRRGVLKGEVDHWCATTIRKRLYFHPPDVPVQVWAVKIDREGLHWFDAEVTRVTVRNVMVRYRGATARLNREALWYWWAWWRGVMFVSSRTGRIAAELDAYWQRRYGHVAGGPPPSMRMPLAEARAMLGVGENYTREEVIAAFRRKAKEAHPDVGGTAEMFRLFVEARDRLLEAIGTSAPPPKPPAYTPQGRKVVYRSERASDRRRLGSGTRRLTGG
jgi:hypothetical protein